jgi:hypothetical protein
MSLDTKQSDRLTQLRQQGTLNQTEITELLQLLALEGTIINRDLGANIVSTQAQNAIQSQDQRVINPTVVTETSGPFGTELGTVSEPAEQRTIVEPAPAVSENRVDVSGSASASPSEAPEFSAGTSRFNP